MHIYDPSAWVVEAGGLGVQHQPWLYNNLKASLSYPGPCAKTDNILSLNSGLFLLLHKMERDSGFLLVFPCNEKVIIWCACGFLEWQRKQSVLKDVSDRPGRWAGQSRLPVQSRGAEFSSWMHLSSQCQGGGDWSISG